MPYEKGALTVLTQAEVDRYNHLAERNSADGEYDNLKEKHYSVIEDAEGPVAYLPHQCDKWIIGGPAEVRALIEDLRAALREMEKP